MTRRRNWARRLYDGALTAPHPNPPPATRCYGKCKNTAQHAQCPVAEHRPRPRSAGPARGAPCSEAAPMPTHAQGQADDQPTRGGAGRHPGKSEAHGYLAEPRRGIPPAPWPPSNAHHQPPPKKLGLGPPVRAFGPGTAGPGLGPLGAPTRGTAAPSQPRGTAGGVASALRRHDARSLTPRPLPPPPEPPGNKFTSVRVPYTSARGLCRGRQRS